MTRIPCCDPCSETSIDRVVERVASRVARPDTSRSASLPACSGVPLTDGSEYRAAIGEAVDAVRDRTDATPAVAVILGTGLGGLVEQMRVDVAMPYEQLPHFPIATVETHTGRLLFGELEGRSIVAMQGRFHRYEGHTLRQVTFPVRVMHLLGAHTLVVSNVSGGMNPLWSPGDIVLIDDHINLLGDNPLVGPNLDDVGPRFPDMSEPYDRGLQALAEQVALEQATPLRRGVYVAVAGPNLETRAEYRMLRAMGADIVGMSTVPEVIVARHMNMKVLGLSIITDQCLPDALEPADINAIIRTAIEAEPKLTALIRGVVARLSGSQSGGSGESAAANREPGIGNQ